MAAARRSRPTDTRDERDGAPDLAMLMKAAEALLLAATNEQEVLNAATTLLGERFGYGTRGVLLFDPQREDLYVASAAGTGAERPELLSYRRRLGEGLVGTCALYRRLVNVADVRRDSRYVPAIPETVSEICVPMVSRDDLLGVLNVESPVAGAFSERDEALLTAFSQLVALALVHARAHQSRRKDLDTISARLAEIQAVHEVAQRAASLDLEGTLQAAVDAIQRLTTADSTAVYLWRPEEEDLQLTALTFDRRLYPSDYEERLRAMRPRLGQGLVGWVAEHRQSLLVGDVTKDERWVGLPGLPLEAKSGIVLPIAAEDRLLGVVRAWKMGTGTFTQDHLRLALTLASQTALALAVANAHREQGARIKELGALYEASLRLSEATTPDDVVEVMVRGAVQIAEAEAGLVWRREADGSFSVAATENVDADAVGQLPPNRAASMTNEMLATGRPILLEDVAGEPSSSWRSAMPRMRSLVGVPLRSEGLVYGALYVLHSRPGFFRPAHVRRLEVLAAQAATTIARARAFDETRRLAITDELTGFYNARYFTTRLNEEIQRAGRYGHSLSLVMIDSDSLKMVNDRFGHEEGNRYLVELAATIRENVRQTDIVARFGGDEFLVLQPETDLSAALITADRIRQAAFRHFASANGETIEVHVSGGVGSFPATAREAEELFRQADLALYVAKRRGKNVVAAAPIAGKTEGSTEA